ncbi:TetR/AcrR family transcriptional regulator [Pontibacter cellulosilyticus]|uniref:TetR/AcrR family transcriptional regulator n=1 Tax=Pontibacter cellulosilyticus TaxID=1720253 RepID=A0A923SPE8_9BACT|nr:TetR/AcrR family transcriptional regulator [Pontibacter cellulosilyticus]MBC5994075.1 TetR/AcrR family transcriptional regulator [Pontibacter cellulosilyticus]
MTFLETILDEILQIFKREGIEANTEADIIRKLDIRSTTFHELFSSRENMVLQVIRYDVEQQKREQSELLAKASNPVEQIMMLLVNGIQKMKQINPVFIADLQKYPEAWQVSINYVTNNNQEVNADILNQGIIEGYFRKDLNLQLVTKIILEQFFMMINPAVFPPGKYDLAEVFRSIYLYYVRGICTDAGGKQAEEFFARTNL